MMNGSGTYDRAGQWIIAGGISIGLHVFGLILIACCHSGRMPAALPDSDVAEVRSDAPEPKAETVPETKPPEVKSEPRAPEPLPKPVVKPEPKPEPVVRPEPKPVVKTEPKPEARPENVPPPRPVAKAGAYVVKKGDTGASIAKQHGCTLAELAKMNGMTLKKLSGLRVGQRLKVPKAD